MKLKEELNLMMSLYLIKTINMNIGQRRQSKEIIQLNLEKKLVPT